MSVYSSSAAAAPAAAAAAEEESKLPAVPSQSIAGYEHFPGPDAQLYAYLLQISGGLTKTGIQTAGVIALAADDAGWFYFATSRSLDLAIGQVAASYAAWAQWIQKTTGGKVWYCRAKVDDDLLAKTTKATKGALLAGCAEKRIITALAKCGQTMKAITVIAHPPSTKKLMSYETVTNSDGNTFIKPCNSCKTMMSIFRGLL